MYLKDEMKGRAMSEIDDLIEILQRVKRCSKALSILKLATSNLIWKDDDWSKSSKAKESVLGLIKEAIELIEKEER